MTTGSMLENVKYNLGREYEFYAMVPLGQKTKHKNGPSGGGSGSLHDRERKKDNMLNISTSDRPSDRGRYERSPAAAPRTYDTVGRLQHTQPAVGN